jgi:hypothetical protein
MFQNLLGPHKDVTGAVLQLLDIRFMPGPVPYEQLNEWKKPSRSSDWLISAYPIGGQPKAEHCVGGSPVSRRDVTSRAEFLPY